MQFTIQSVSKLILLAVALEDAGFEAVFSKVGMEPSGDQFNSIYRLELVNPHPLNPMVNAGAIAVSSCITGQSVDDRFQKVRRMAARCLGVASVACSEKVFCCETKIGHRNQALAQMMKDKGVIDGAPEEHLAVYYHACSMLTDCHLLSYFGAVLANGGRTPQAEQEILPPQTARLLRVLMASCGLYNRAGEFAFQVGIPAKSGSVGGIMAAVLG
ncbi:MAG: glutaminase [Lawsonibacter sp.]|nr:glutaminase [Lawsonibacter sp.]